MNLNVNLQNYHMDIIKEQKKTFIIVRSKDYNFHSKLYTT